MEPIWQKVVDFYADPQNEGKVFGTPPYDYDTWVDYLKKEVNLKQAVEEARAAVAARAETGPTSVPSSIPPSSVRPQNLEALVAEYEQAQQDAVSGAYTPGLVFREGFRVKENAAYARLFEESGFYDRASGVFSIPSRNDPQGQTKLRELNRKISLLNACQKQRELLRDSIHSQITRQSAAGMFGLPLAIVENELVKDKVFAEALEQIDQVVAGEKIDLQELNQVIGEQEQKIHDRATEISQRYSVRLEEMLEGRGDYADLSQLSSSAQDSLRQAQETYQRLRPEQRQNLVIKVQKAINDGLTDPFLGAVPQSYEQVKISQKQSGEVAIKTTAYHPPECSVFSGQKTTEELKSQEMIAISVPTEERITRDFAVAGVKLNAGEARRFGKQMDVLGGDASGAFFRFFTTDIAQGFALEFAKTPESRQRVIKLFDNINKGRLFNQPEVVKWWEASTNIQEIGKVKIEEGVKNATREVLKGMGIYTKDNQFVGKVALGWLARKTVEAPLSLLAIGFDKVGLKKAGSKIRKRRDEEDNGLIILLKLLADVAGAVAKTILGPVGQWLVNRIPEPVRFALRERFGGLIDGVRTFYNTGKISLVALKGLGWGTLYGYIISGGNPFVAAGTGIGSYVWRWLAEAGRNDFLMRKWGFEKAVGGARPGYSTFGKIANGLGNRWFLRGGVFGATSGWEVGLAVSGGNPLVALLFSFLGLEAENAVVTIFTKVFPAIFESIGKFLGLSDLFAKIGAGLKGNLGNLFALGGPWMFFWDVLVNGVPWGEAAIRLITNPTFWIVSGPTILSGLLKLFGFWPAVQSIGGFFVGLFYGLGSSLGVALSGLGASIAAMGAAGIFAVGLLGIVAVLVTINIFSAFKSFEDEKRWRNLTRPESACFRPSKTADKYKVVAGDTIKYTIDLGTKPVGVKEISLTDEVYIGGTTQVTSETQTDCAGPYIFDDASIAGLLSGVLVSPKPDSSYKTISTSGGGCWIKLRWSNLSPNAVVTYTLKTDSGYKETEEITNTLRLDGKVDKKTPTDPDVDCGVQLETAVNAQRKNSCPVRGTISCPSISCHGSADYCAGDLQSLCDSVGIPTGISRGSPDFGKALDIAAPPGTEVFAPEAMAGDKVDLWTLAYTNEGNPKYGGGWAIRLEGKGQPSLLGAAPRKYVLRIAHLARAGTVGATYAGGSSLNNTVFNSPLGSHIHMELEVDAGYVKPEDYICR